MDRPYSVLFLCTGNSARSILAEAILNREGAGKFRGHSAGSYPKPEPHPFAIDLLKRLNYDTSFARSKSWDEFAAPGAPHMDFVFTVCDDAAAEVCPIWPGQPVTAHWGVPDPAAATGNEAQRHLAFAEAYKMLAGPHLDLREPADRLARPAEAAAAARSDRGAAPPGNRSAGLTRCVSTCAAASQPKPSAPPFSSARWSAPVSWPTG